ncbi:epi-neemfruitin B 7-O-acetyltransferse L7AT-like [Arachis hypogaea]|uniref:epi-neemfruitin B 7-O-acetyltransferse L7AT-like n=1 Tax=Arachis hypogaea TaxID=3818 RepID=UPI000DEC80A2|nr:salutaridinol 7-O-acetyltransferase-like [Arachis hypogaea]
MKDVKVEIISRENIRPSSPTPSHLRTFKHSLLDQLVPIPYAIVILFYSSHNLSEFSKRLELLKQSLSETLTQFYPLSGKIKDDLSIDCNDEGANFVVAKVNCPILEFLEKPDMDSLHKFLPISNPLSLETFIGTHVTNIQVNVFDCGGIAIGFCISHKIIDGGSLDTFLKMWTEKTNINRDLKLLTEPNFSTSSLFPTSTLHFRDLSKKIWSSLFREEKWVTRRFLFTNSAINTLKAQILAKSSSDNPLKNHPTRVQIVSAFLWKCFMAASKLQFETQRPCGIIHMVNLRRRMDKSLRPENSIGNFLWFTLADHMDEHELSLDELVSKLKNSIELVDKDFVAILQSDEGSSIMENGLRILDSKIKDEELEAFSFSSWCNFGYYDADFGWGKPMWVSNIGLKSTYVFLNMIFLVDTKFKDGIEAWVTLDEMKMKHLELFTELLNYATLDPSPLTMSNSRL